MSYKELKSYKQATTIYDLTIDFCVCYVEPYGTDKTYKSYESDKPYETYGAYKTYKFTRMSDQMIQAARSGKQNIVEGSAASKNNPKSELMLLGVARASFQELLEDYQDFLRQKGLVEWGKDDPRVIKIRNLAYVSDKPHMSYKTDRSYKIDESYKSSYKSYEPYETYKFYLDDPEKAANMMITLINQTNFLLDRQIAAVKNQHEKSGAIKEPHSYKLKRIFEENRKKEEEFNKYLKGILNKNGDK